MSNNDNDNNDSKEVEPRPMLAMVEVHGRSMYYHKAARLGYIDVKYGPVIKGPVDYEVIIDKEAFEETFSRCP